VLKEIRRHDPSENTLRNLSQKLLQTIKLLSSGATAEKRDRYRGRNRAIAMAMSD
jgi:hypothetical protein